MFLFFFIFLAFTAVVFVFDTREPDINISIQTDEELEVILLELSECESSLDPRAINDQEPNGLVSRGLFQFQYPLVRDYFFKRYGVTVDERSYQKIAHHPAHSRNMAREIIRHDFQGGIHNWFNCAKKIK